MVSNEMTDDDVASLVEELSGYDLMGRERAWALIDGIQDKTNVEAVVTGYLSGLSVEDMTRGYTGWNKRPIA